MDQVTTQSSIRPGTRIKSVRVRIPASVRKSTTVRVNCRLADGRCITRILPPLTSVEKPAC